MSTREYCPRCLWRTRHKDGVCIECGPDAPPQPRDDETIDLFGDEATPSGGRDHVH